MGKIFDQLKKYSFGGYRTGLYNKETVIFGTFLSLILSVIFLLGLITGIGFYFISIFIERPESIILQTDKLVTQTDLLSYSLPLVSPIFKIELRIFINGGSNKTCDDLKLTYIFDTRIFYDMKMYGYDDFCNMDLFGNENYTKFLNDSEIKFPGFS